MDLSTEDRQRLQDGRRRLVVWALCVLVVIGALPFLFFFYWGYVAMWTVIVLAAIIAVTGPPGGSTKLPSNYR